VVGWANRRVRRRASIRDLEHGAGWGGRSARGGALLHGSYGACPGILSNATDAGDSGNICLGLNSTTACQEPITLTPAVVTFPAQMLNSPTTTQTITLANNSGSTLNGLTLQWQVDTDRSTEIQRFRRAAEFFGAGYVHLSLRVEFLAQPGGSCTITVSLLRRKAALGFRSLMEAIRRASRGLRRNIVLFLWAQP